MSPGTAFRHKNAAQEEGGQLVASDVDHRVVKHELVLGVPLPEIAHVIREDSEVVRDLGDRQPTTRVIKARPFN